VVGYVGLLLYGRRLEALGVLRLSWLLSYVGRVLLATLAAGAVSYGIARTAFAFPDFALANLLPLALGGLVGGVVFLGLARLLRLSVGMFARPA
jgi:hypothetical protein